MRPNQFKDIEDYGVIGNLETCALVGTDGSVDWLCLPYLESSSAFAALLDTGRGGHFSISPPGKFRSLQNYIKNTNVLITAFHTPFGEASVTDFMPVKTQEDKQFITTLFRKVEWISGEVELEMEFCPRFDYARAETQFEEADGGIVASHKGESLFLQSPVPLNISSEGARAVFKVGGGDTLWFVLHWNKDGLLATEDCQGFLDRTLKFWGGWAHRCKGHDCLFAGPWHDLIVRSGLVLKLLTNSDNGAIAAAATTSLPERIGSVRNWDYRFSWVRDAAFTVQALFHIGSHSEALNYREWFQGILPKDKNLSNLKILYPLRGEADTSEQTLGHLSGYMGSAPVRVGNAAAGQRQLDIYGEFVNMVYETSRYGREIRQEEWDIVKEMVEYVCEEWDTPDSGIWEARSKPLHYVYSKLMCWVAVDRGIKIAGLKGFDFPGKWERARFNIKMAILDKGFSENLGSFTRSFDSEDLDATGLLIPVMGLLPFDDPKVQGTIDAIMGGLMTSDGMVARYKTEDGLPGQEGNFILCSFWLVRALSLSGRHDEAEKVFMDFLKFMSPLGLLSEEVDNKTGKLLGNFPQAFSHLGFITAAIHLGIAKGKKTEWPKPTGEEHRTGQLAIV